MPDPPVADGRGAVAAENAALRCVFESSGEDGVLDEAEAGDEVFLVCVVLACCEGAAPSCLSLPRVPDEEGRQHVLAGSRLVRAADRNGDGVLHSGEWGAAVALLCPRV